MPKSLSQVNAQIAKLQKEAESIKSKELSGVISRIREAIEHYGLTAKDLGLDGTAGASRGARVTNVPAPRPDAPAKRRTRINRNSGVIKFKDGEGRTWTGHGRAPNWYKEAIAKGKKPEDLTVTLR